MNKGKGKPMFAVLTCYHMTSFPFVTEYEDFYFNTMSIFLNK